MYNVENNRKTFNFAYPSTIIIRFARWFLTDPIVRQNESILGGDQPALYPLNVSKAIIFLIYDPTFSE